MSEQTKSSSAHGTNAFDLPKANVQRIVKNALPDGVMFVGDAKVAISKAAVVFIMYLTATAQENAIRNKRAMLQAEDVLDALKDLEFQEFEDEVRRAIKVHEKVQKKKKAPKQQKEPAQQVTSEAEVIPQ